MTETINYRIDNYDVHNQTRSCIDYFNDEQKQSLAKDGYLKLPYRLSLDEINKFTLTAERLLKENHNDGQVQTTYKGKNFAGKYLRQPHLQDLLFMNLLTNQYPFVDMARSIMGPRIAVRSFNIRTTLPQSNDGTKWHSDQFSYVIPKPLFFTEPHIFTFAIYLDSANENTGPLYLVPGTHRLDEQPSEKEYFQDIENQVSLILDGGEIVLFHSALWHRGGENKSTQKRRVILLHFAPIFCKIAEYENMIPSAECRTFIDELRQKEDEAFLELLGMPRLGYK